MRYRDLNVLDAAARAADKVKAVIDRGLRRLLYAEQLRRAVQSVGANIGEGLGRRAVPAATTLSESPAARPRRGDPAPRGELPVGPNPAGGLLAAARPASRDREVADVYAAPLSAAAVERSRR